MKFKTLTLAAALMIAAPLMAAVNAGPQGPLTPRVPVPKVPQHKLNRPNDATGRLIVKFVDSAQVRPQADGSARSRSNVSMRGINELLVQHGAKLAWAFPGQDDAFLARVQDKAAAVSRKAQPDLGSMMYVTGAAEGIDAIVKVLNQRPEVEWVQYETRMYTFGPPDPTCETPPVGAGNCLAVTDAPPIPYCTDADCCNLVCGLDAFCCSEDPFEGQGFWDEFCVAYAELFCGLNPTDPCLSEATDSCFEVHPAAGCLDTPCCLLVCAQDDFCCTNFWDDLCVDAAFQLCLVPVAGTGDFRPQQGYLRPVDYTAYGPPADIYPLAPDFPGYNGVGYNLQGADYGLGAFDPVADAEAGLYGMSTRLFNEFGIGQTNPPGSDDVDDLVNNTRGRGIRVAVIEWGFYVDHEDLDVTIEPGQTVIQFPDVTEPDHATACLGIIGARDDNNGVIGIAPEAELHFFPLTSVEEGPRELAAWTSAILSLDQGDVISASFGPFPNLNCQQFSWTLIRLAADAGITVCVAAGNDCFDLDNAEDLGDSGGIVVGAGSPGRNHYRLPFSNYFSGDGEGNRVHVQAWGDGVTSCGYGTLSFPGFDPTRSYTNMFNGTSAAAPQIAALCACLQGLAKQFYGIALLPEQIRGSFAGGFPQDGNPNPDNLPGFNPGQGCGFDRDPDTGPNKIGPFPITAGTFESAASTILNQSPQGFDESPLIDSFSILRGSLQFGTIYSLKASDNSWMGVSSSSTNPGTQPNLTGLLGGSQLNPGGGGGVDEGDSGSPTIGGTPAQHFPTPTPYRVFGNATDVVVGGRALGGVSALTLTTEVHTTTANLSIMFIEMFNWQLNRWVFVDFRFVQAPGAADECTADGGAMTDGIDCTQDHPVTSPNQYFRPSDGRFLIRMWTVAPGALSLTGHTMLFDFIGVNTGPELGGPDD